MVKIGYLHRMREKEAEMIAGMYRRNKVAEYNLYEYCAEYYYSKHGALFRAMMWRLMKFFKILL
jgi:hypothetical protein